jgi:hypothetical protein
MSGLKHFVPGLLQVWEYSPSHARLLLRRTRTENLDHQEDLLFKNVSWISLPTGLHDVTIEQLDQPEAIPDQNVESLMLNRSWYRMRGTDGSGFVIAGFFASQKNQLATFDESPLMRSTA